MDTLILHHVKMTCSVQISHPSQLSLNREVLIKASTANSKLTATNFLEWLYTTATRQAEVTTMPCRRFRMCIPVRVGNGRSLMTRRFLSLIKVR